MHINVTRLVSSKTTNSSDSRKNSTQILSHSQSNLFYVFCDYVTCSLTRVARIGLLKRQLLQETLYFLRLQNEFTITISTKFAYCTL